jgi:ubiquinone/menaquinone biosynthesis C-methylase UbiE
MTSDGRDGRVPPTLVDANRLWVDSRLRAVAQRRFEARVLHRLGGSVPHGTVLEIGSGRRGTGLRLALDTFAADRADGIELHPASVVACRAALADLGDRVRVTEGDAAHLPAADAAYDAVFDYHLLHHAQDWRRVVGEVARVLRPDGRFYACEMTARIVDSRGLRAVSYHPADGDRPTPASLAAACADAGLRVTGQLTRVAGCWTALVAVKI